MAITSQHILTSYTKNFTGLDPIQTTGNTQTTIWQVPLNQLQSARIIVNFICENSAFNTVAGGSQEAVFARASGGNVTRTSNLDTIGLIGSILDSFGVTKPTVTITANTSSQTMDVKVTGLAATTLNWHIEVISYLSL